MGDKQAISQVKNQEDIYRSAGDNLEMISRIIPWLQQRQHAAIRWRHADHTNIKMYEEMIEKCNENIKTLLAL